MKTVKELEREAYMSGKPIPQRVLELMDAGENLPRSVGDIQVGFPSEDCLSGPIETIKHMIKYTHKNNKLIPDLIHLLEALNEKQDELNRNAEYGASELKALERTLGI